MPSGSGSRCSGPRSPRGEPKPMAIPDAVLSDLRQELERQKIRLERSMSLTEEAVRPVELDQQAVGRLSRMDSMQNQQMSRNLQDREQARYAAIRTALERMDRGEYGSCADCGDEIQAGRLFVVPEIAHCPACSG
ncbi:MAG: hypothetical protein EA351_04585 [Gemmatimonadales bacterium]|nr:MAG: hypothetical protein EA351_04585 [Gemmatimonadales bacterium]